MQNLSLQLLNFLPPHFSMVLPWAWMILRQLRARSFRSNRYRLGLPAHGQRTHTNASTVGRVHDAASMHIRSER